MHLLWGLYDQKSTKICPSPPPGPWGVVQVLRGTSTWLRDYNGLSICSSRSSSSSSSSICVYFIFLFSFFIFDFSFDLIFDLCLFLQTPVMLRRAEGLNIRRARMLAKLAWTIFGDIQYIHKDFRISWICKETQKVVHKLWGGCGCWAYTLLILNIIKNIEGICINIR